VNDLELEVSFNQYTISLLTARSGARRGRIVT